MSAAHPDVRWEAQVGRDTRFRRLDHEAVVFNPESGETQLLTAVAAAVLEALRRSPATPGELIPAVTALLSAEASSADVLVRVCEILDELNRLGLARPCLGVRDAAR